MYLKYKKLNFNQQFCKTESNLNNMNENMEND
jgi:hypothetical protein